MLFVSLIAIILVAGCVIEPEPASTNCTEEGRPIPVIANPPSCCTGLTLIKPKEERTLGSAGICTAKCGNGVCDDETETSYNCQADCNSTTNYRGPLDCGADFDCFIEASRNCTPANRTSDITVNIFGIVQTTTSFNEIKEGGTPSNCTFYVRTESMNLKFSEELVKQMKAGNATDEQIKLQEEESNKQADFAEGLDGTCIFKTEDLTSMLNRWKTGAFSTEDWVAARCSGKMFSQQDLTLSENQSLNQSSEENECVVSSDCQANFHCMDGNCISNEILNDFQNCEAEVCEGGACSFDACSQTCGNCKDDKMICMHSSEAIKDKKCVECFMSQSQCKEGYACKEYRCVPQ